MRLDPATRRTKLLQKDLRVGDLAFNAADKSLWGIRHLNGLATLVRITPPYTDWERVITWPYGTVMYDLDVSPDGTRVSASFGEISGKQDVRVFDVAALRDGDTTPVARFDFGTAVPNGFVFSPDGRYLYGSSYYTGVSNIFRYDLDGEEARGRQQHRDRLLPAGAARRRPAARVPLHRARASCPPGSIRQPLEDVSADHVPRRTADQRAPGPEELDARLAGQDPVRHDGEDHRRCIGLGGGLRRESIYPDRPGLQGHAAVGVRAQLSDPLQLNRLAHHRRLVAGHVAADAASGCICRPTTSATTGAPRRR